MVTQVRDLSRSLREYDFDVRVILGKIDEAWVMILVEDGRVLAAVNAPENSISQRTN